MSKVTLTTLGSTGIAASVPLMHLLSKHHGTDIRKGNIVKGSTMILFIAGWILLAIGLSKPPPGTEDEVTKKWKKRQIALSISGVAMVMAGVAGVRYRKKLKIPLAVGSTAFVGGWAALAAAIFYADPDTATMDTSEKVGRAIQSATSTLMVIAGAALISMSDQSQGLVGLAPEGAAVPLTPSTLEAAAVTTFVLGWANVASVSAMQ